MQGIVVLTDDAPAACRVTPGSPRRRPSRELAYELTIAAGRERERLANELHDGLGQLLAIAQIRIDELDACTNHETRRELVEDLRGLLGEASRATHAAMFDLHSPVLGQLGLLPALQGLGERMARLGRFEFELRGTIGAPPLPLPVQGVVLRVARELLVNACKHARAGRVGMQVDDGHANLAITVIDDGCGYDTSALHSKGTGGFGLLSITAQMEAVGGRLDISSTPGCGTSAVITLPYAAAARFPLPRRFHPVRSWRQVQRA